MKNLFVILIFCLIANLSFSQKIVSKGSGEVKDLKECVENYSVVVLQLLGGIETMTSIGDGDIFYFVDERNGGKLKMKTTVEILNFMWKNGWEYINTIGGNGEAAPQMIFKKK
jgi:hypothetical protein